MIQMREWRELEKWLKDQLAADGGGTHLFRLAWNSTLTKMAELETAARDRTESATPDC